MNGDRYGRTSVLLMTEIAEELLRRCEEAGIVSPLPGEEELLYSEEMVEKIRMIRRLTDELEVNLPGVEVILNMRDQMLAMQEEFNRLIEDIRRGLLKELGHYEARFNRPLIEGKGGRAIRVRIRD